MGKLWSGDTDPEPDWSGGDTDLSDWHDDGADTPTDPEPDWVESDISGDDASGDDSGGD